jgi:curved DNA-binding protein
MKFRDYYEVMDVSRTASADEIKRAYRKLARKFHPDVSKETNAEAKFKELQEAYEVLKDPEKRKAYDQLGQNWKAGQEFRPPPDWGRDFNFGDAARGARRGRARGGDRTADFSDFFSELFGGGGPFGRTQSPGGRPGGFAAAGQDHVARVEIELEDAYRGTQRMIELSATEVTPDGDVVVKPRSLRVSIPAGVTHGQRIRLGGQGGSGFGGGPAGDLYLEIALRPHRQYEVDGRNVTTTVPVAPWEAALGETIAVPTLGGPVEMKLPAGASSGQKLRLRGRGLPGNPAGDEFIVLRIVMPPDSPRARELFEQMKRELRFDPRGDAQAR